MAKSAPEAKLEYLMHVFRHTDLSKPDWRSIAQATGQSSANNAQKKYKSIVESLGFKLVDNQIIDPNSDANTNTTTVSTPKGRKTASTKSTPARKTNATPKTNASAKKRRFEGIDSSDEDGGGDYSGQGKKAKTVQREVKHEQVNNIGADTGPNNDDDDDTVEIVSEGVVAGGFRARSMTVKPDPVTTDDEDDAV